MATLQLVASTLAYVLFYSLWSIVFFEIKNDFATFRRYVLKNISLIVALIYSFCLSEDYCFSMDPQ